MNAIARILAIAPLALGLASPLGASVTVSVDMDPGTPGIQNSLQALPGQNLTVDLVIAVDAAGVSSYSISLNSDTVELSLNGAPAAANNSVLPGGLTSLAAPSESRALGQVHSFNGATLGIGPVSTSFVIGSIAFTAPMPATDSSLDLTPGFFQPLIDGMFDNAGLPVTPVFSGGTLDLSPLGATVTTLADSGPGSLRATIAALPPGGTITFDPSLDGGTIALASQISLDKNLTVDASALPGGLTISGNGSSRVLEIGPSPTVVARFDVGGDSSNGSNQTLLAGWADLNPSNMTATQNGVTLTIGDTSPESRNRTGPVIAGNPLENVLRDFLFTRSSDGAVAVTFSGLTANVDYEITGYAYDSSGANNETGYWYLGSVAPANLQHSWLSSIATLDDPGDIFVLTGTADSSGTLTYLVTTDNTSRINGFVVRRALNVTLDSLTLTGGNAQSDPGGGINNSGTLTLNQSTLSGNEAKSGGGIYNSGTLTLNQCTFAGNSAEDGGGIYNNGTLTLIQSTIAGNSGAYGVGIYNTGMLTLIRSTLSGNTGTNGGGISNDGTLTLADSIVADNSAPLAPDVRNTDGSINVSGTNLISDLSESGLLADPSILVGGAQLAPLGDYGGPTRTMPPLPGSPAIDAAGTTDPGGTDQRGLPRFVNGALDIGAVETGNAAPGFDVVASLDDNVNGAADGVSLREAIVFAVSGSNITFDPLLDGLTITLGGSQILLHKDVHIDASALANGITISGNNASRVFEIAAGTTASLANLTLTGGNATEGGGIRIASGTLTLRDMTLSQNVASDGGGGLYSIGSAVVIINSTISDNSASYAGGLRKDEGIMQLENVTLVNNAATTGTGGGIDSFSGMLEMNSCTISGNSTSVSGGGITIYEGTVNLRNTIIAANTAPVGPDVENTLNPGTLALTGGNLLGDAADSGLSAGQQVILAADPLLAPLGNYGGPAATMPPLPGSPAIDAGALPPTNELAAWTFETSQPDLQNQAIITGIAAENGPATASASGIHADPGTDYTNPLGNGSVESFGSNSWAIGDYYEFSVPGTGHSTFTVTFAQTSSSTGPAEFTFEYSVDGSNFTAFADYTVLENGSPFPSWNSSVSEPAYNFVFDLSDVTALNDASNVHFRLTCRSNVSASGGTIGIQGASRVDNFVVSAVPILTDQRGFARPNGPAPDIGAVEAYAFTSQGFVDTDSDGIDDRLETGIFGNLTTANATSDTDGDGSSDKDEIANMTNARDPNDSFRILSFTKAAGFTPANPAFDLTMSTFPGLNYRLERQSDLTNAFQPFGDDFTATEFTSTFQVTLSPSRDFVRAARK